MVPRGGRTVLLFTLLVVTANAKYDYGHDDHGGHGGDDHGPGHYGDMYYTEGPHGPPYIHEYTTDMPGIFRPLKPDKVPQEWHHYGEFYCPLNDDDCGWKPDREKHFCWKAFPHTTANLENAYHDCKARSIKGCPSRLLAVDYVKDVYYSMTYEDIEYCPPNLRIDGKISVSGDWYDFLHDYMLEFPGEPWTNDTMEPFEPNNKDGSLTVNFGARSISGFAHDEDEEIGIICQSCVIEIPECPHICERCDEGTTTPQPMSTTDEKPYRCNNIEGDLIISVVGGWNLLTDMVSSTWTVYDENYNECDAGYNMVEWAEEYTIAAYFPLPHKMYDFGLADYSPVGKFRYSQYEEYVGGPPFLLAYDMKILAGGVVVKKNGKRYVTDCVYMKMSDDRYFGGLRSGSAEENGAESLSRKGGPRFPEEPGGIAPEKVDSMTMPRAGFSLMSMFVVHEYDVSLRKFFVAYGGFTDMDGTLTDTIEFRSFGDPEDHVFASEWQVSQFTLNAPSRTMGATLQESLFTAAAEFVNYRSETPRHIVALVDTNPVEFMVFKYDNVTYRELTPVEDEQIIPPLQLEDGELAGFVVSNNTGLVTLVAIDNVTRNTYTITFDELVEDGMFASHAGVEWQTNPDAIPEGLTFRHLINDNEDFTLQSRTPISLLAYSEEEQLSVVKFYDVFRNVFNDDYKEGASYGFPLFGSSQTLDLPFPVKLDLPPIVGAAVGLDLGPVLSDSVTAVTFENSIMDQYNQDYKYVPFGFRSASLDTDSTQWRRLKSAAETRASPEVAQERKTTFKAQGKGLKMAAAKHSEDLNRKISEVSSKMAAGVHLAAI